MMSSRNLSAKNGSFVRPSAPNVQRSCDCLSRQIKLKTTSGIRSVITSWESLIMQRIYLAITFLGVTVLVLASLIGLERMIAG
jgi:hypothetical protein